MALQAECMQSDVSKCCEQAVRQLDTRLTQDLGPSDEGTCQAHELSLTHAEILASFSDLDNAKGSEAENTHKFRQTFAGILAGVQAILCLLLVFLQTQCCKFSDMQNKRNSEAC